MTVVDFRRKAVPADYVMVGDGYWLLPWVERFVPGALTHDPECGAAEFNGYLEVAITRDTASAAAGAAIAEALAFCLNHRGTPGAHLLRALLCHAYDRVAYPSTVDLALHTSHLPTDQQALVLRLFVHQAHVYTLLSPADLQALTASALAPV